MHLFVPHEPRRTSKLSTNRVRAREFNICRNHILGYVNYRMTFGAEPAAGQPMTTFASHPRRGQGVARGIAFGSRRSTSQNFPKLPVLNDRRDTKTVQFPRDYADFGLQRPGGMGNAPRGGRIARSASIAEHSQEETNPIAPTAAGATTARVSRASVAPKAQWGAVLRRLGAADGGRFSGKGDAGRCSRRQGRGPSPRSVRHASRDRGCRSR